MSRIIDNKAYYDILQKFQSGLLVNNKTHFIVAALTAALLASPFANAASGFSRNSSSSSSSKSVTSPARADTRTSYGSYSSFSASSAKKADTPRVAAYAPAMPSPAPAAVPSPARSGFSAAAKTGGAVAGVATASALGGAMYSASANRNAVDAYQAKQKAAAAPQVAQDTSSRAPAAMTQATASNYQPHQQSQVIVVQQSAPQYHDSHSSLLTNAFWYESGRAAARRDERERDYQYAQMQQAQAAQTQAQAAQMQAQAAQAQVQAQAQTQSGYAPSVQPVAPSVAPTTAAYPSTAHTPAELKAVEAQKEHHMSVTLILMLALLIGAVMLIVWLVTRQSKSKAAAKANYTL